MYWFVRPDAALAFEDGGVKKALGRYVRVSRNELPANFIISRSISVNFDPSKDNLWEIHSQVIEKYREKKREVDSKRLKPEDLEPAESSLLDLKAAIAQKMLEACNFCERRCGVNRLKDERGFCQAGKEARLSSEFIHMGEEACLVPSHTFFFIGCNLYCVYCQNWRIARRFEAGTVITGEELAKFAKARRIVDKSRNVNLVGGEPTPNLHVILDMLRKLDINVPIVWNSNMYMSEEAMKLLEGMVDVYLSDFKYGNDACAERLSKVKKYTEVVKRNHLLAKEQAELLIRHLVLPGHLKCCTSDILKWIAENLDNEVRVNIMGQYRPDFEAYPEISRRVTSDEVAEAFRIAKELNLTNLD